MVSMAITVIALPIVVWPLLFAVPGWVVVALLAGAHGTEYASIIALEKLIADHSGKTPEEVNNDIERDKILTAEAAVEYGLIDAVFTPRKELVPHSNGRET